MIIKSMTRKSNNFRQLINYLQQRIDLVEVPWIIANNLGCSPLESEKIIQSFKENDKFRKKRKNGNALYHEIISLPPTTKGLCLAKPWLLENIVRQYINLRSPDSLSYAIPHLHQNDNPHAHIVFSANEKESDKSIRISKTEFKKIKKEMNIEFEKLIENQSIEVYFN